MSRSKREFKVILRVKELRESKGMSSLVLSKRAGLYQSQLSSLESGKTEPMISTLVLLALALDCSIDDLIDMEKTSEGIQEWEEKLKC